VNDERPGRLIDILEMFQIVLRSQYDGRIVSFWRLGRSGAGWYAEQPTKFTIRADAERELDSLRQSQVANVPRIFIERAQ
jgi:hypothetical protein